MTDLNFTKKDGMQQSDAILCGDEGIVTFAIKIDDGKVHTLLAQHSVDGENWQNVGTMDFVQYAEVNVDGLRLRGDCSSIIGKCTPRSLSSGNTLLNTSNVYSPSHIAIIQK